MIVRSKFGLVAPVLAVVALGALAGCSSTPSASGGGSAAGGSGTSGSTNVCSLVGASAASSAMGLTFTGTKSASLGTGMDNCSYATSASSFALIVEVYQANSGTNWTTLEGVLSSLGPVKTVSGVGDKAVIGNSQLDVQAGSRFIAISGDSVGKNPSGAEALAKKFVSALG
jgi:hypothetical protein